jgi:hypothetical protein
MPFSSRVDIERERYIYIYRERERERERESSRKFTTRFKLSNRYSYLFSLILIPSCIYGFPNFNLIEFRFSFYSNYGLGLVED